MNVGGFIAIHTLLSLSNMHGHIIFKYTAPLLWNPMLPRLIQIFHNCTHQKKKLTYIYIIKMKLSKVKNTHSHVIFTITSYV